MKYLNLYIFCFLFVIQVINCEKLGCQPITAHEKLNIEFDVKLHFYTPQTCTTYSSSLSPNKNLKNFLRDSCFNPDINKVFIIIHGFQDSASARWVTQMVNALISREKNVNVIAVDWSGAFSLGWNLWNIADYRRAALATSKAAELLSKKIKSIASVINIPLGNWEFVHFIGHSLGAHVAGQAARMLNNRVNFWTQRVTGLDPAYPCFEDDSSYQRLKKSDAYLVDVIHTNSEPGPNPNLGTFEPLGHLDFYLNGGNNQFCCNSSRGGKTLNRIVSRIAGIDSTNLMNTFWNRKFAPICDHNYAPLIFTQTIEHRKDTRFPVKVTRSEYKEGSPVQEIDEWAGAAEVGINAWHYKALPGVFYVNTRNLKCPETPYDFLYKFNFG